MLRVITHTRPGEKHRYFNAMKESVDQALSRVNIECEHKFIELESKTELDFSKARLDSIEGADPDDLLCWVDDDDLVSVDAFRFCVHALKRTQAGIAFTYEQRIDSEGELIGKVETRQRHYAEAAVHPRTIHHLAMFRRSSIPDYRWELMNQHHIGAEWVIRSGTALNEGAIQVPYIGYQWRIHGDNRSLTDSWTDKYIKEFEGLSNALHSNMKFSGPIPIYQPVANYSVPV